MWKFSDKLPSSAHRGIIDGYLISAKLAHFYNNFGRKSNLFSIIGVDYWRRLIEHLLLAFFKLHSESNQAKTGEFE